MEGCPFILGNDKGTEQYYHFCKGTSACQLIQDKRICDGRFNCFDRQVDMLYSFTNFLVLVSMNGKH